MKNQTLTIDIDHTMEVSVGKKKPRDIGFLLLSVCNENTCYL